MNLLPGETKRIRLYLDRRAFSFFEKKQHDWNAEPGDFGILIGNSSADIRLRGTFHFAAHP